MLRFRSSLIAAALVLGSIAAAVGANTVLFSSRTGDIVFPISPPDSSGNPGAIDNMTIGATTPRAATVTNLTVTGTASGASLVSLTAPGPIGSVTPNTGAFTTVNASDMITSTAGAPTIASGACGTTTNGVVTSGTNQSGLITIGSAATTTCTVSFSKTLAAAPSACVIFPASAGAADAATTVARISSITTSQFVITGSALASTAYYYLCL